jgi:hypothetical protein
MSKLFPQVKIELEGAGKGHVFINGEEVPSVIAVRFSASRDEATMVSIDMLADVEATVWQDATVTTATKEEKEPCK